MAQADVARYQDQPSRNPAFLLIPVAIGAAVAVALGVYGREHDPAQSDLPELFFSGTINLKVWFATGAIVLAVTQLYLAGVMYGKAPYPGTPPSWINWVHRGTGTLALLLTLPVAYHCLYSLGFQDGENGDVAIIGDERVFIHGLFGCIWFGAFAAKVAIVEWKGLPGWALPAAGGLLFAVITVVWYTSAYWFFREIGFPEF